MSRWDKALALTLAALFLASATIVSAYTTSPWSVQTVDKNGAGMGNGYCPIAIDNNGIPHILYAGHNPPAIYDIVRYASLNDSQWSIQEIPYGTAVDLKLDSRDRPHILYKTNGDLSYGVWTGTVWKTQLIEKGNIIYASLALDSFDKPHAVYSVGKELHYSSWTGSDWNSQEIDNIDEGFTGTITFDKNNNPYILYSPFSYADYNLSIGIRAIGVKLATYQNSSWSIQTIPLQPPTGDYGNIVLDSDGYPHFVCTQHHFVSQENMTLLSNFLYVGWNGSAWTTQTIVSDINSNNDFALDHLALDSHNYPHFNYISSIGKLMYVYRNDSAWNIKPVDTNISVRPFGASCYLAIDSLGNPHMSYFGVTTVTPYDRHLSTMVYATANATELTPLPTTQSALPWLQILTIVVTVVVVVTIAVYVRKKKSMVQAGNR